MLRAVVERLGEEGKEAYWSSDFFLGEERERGGGVPVARGEPLSSTR